ncbi:MAG: hypothetical protein HRU18_07370 [Pseudoalteromonas sp.]|uniref:hypothetical protein n=1 Tax=Pseudoalteromonas sp. TaxID=53249 RepID=UPI001D41ECAD|nr:hypothetical protein [Pseudoalteromonas sp.]NRA78012.1 hypothetical protein [Pseudoalteromonas sp.]
MKDRFLTLREIEFYVEHASNDIRGDVKSYFSMRSAALSEDPNYEGQNESKLLSEWIELCPDLARIITLEYRCQGE